MNHFPTKILLATDGSEDAAQAREAAVDLARKGSSELHLVHVWHDVPSPYAHAFVKRELKRQGQEILDEQVTKIKEAGGTVAKAHLKCGRTSDEVIRLSEELGAGLLVVGSRGRGRVRRILMGSHSEDIVHHAHLPVLVLRCVEDAWPPARVVIGDDLSEEAKEAGELAASIARLFLRTLMPLLHILQTFSQVYTERLTQFNAEGQTSIRVGRLADRPAPLHVVIAPFIDSGRDRGSPSWTKVSVSRQT